MGSDRVWIVSVDSGEFPDCPSMIWVAAAASHEQAEEMRGRIDGVIHEHLEADRRLRPLGWSEAGRNPDPDASWGALRREGERINERSGLGVRLTSMCSVGVTEVNVGALVLVELSDSKDGEGSESP